MLMLTAYFDESGTTPPSKILTIAGYLSTVQRWEKFEIEWLALLDEYNLEYSHAVDFAHFKMGFKREEKDVERRKEFYKKACKIIKDNTIQPFDISLIWEDYNVLISFYKGKDKPPAYGVLVNRLLFMVAEWARDNEKYFPIHYVFERNKHIEGWMARNYAQASKDIATGGAWQFGSLTFAEGKVELNGRKPLVQLQAADMNAYEVNKYRHDDLDGTLAKRGKPRGLLINLRPDNTTYRFDRNGLEVFLKEIEANDEQEN